MSPISKFEVVVEWPEDMPRDAEVDGDYSADFTDGPITGCFTFRVDAGTEPRIRGIYINAAADDGWLTTTDLRRVDLHKLLKAAVAQLPGREPPQRGRLDLTGETLQAVARIWHETAGHRPTAAAAIGDRLHKSRSQSYRLLQRAEEAGYLTSTTEGTEK